MSATRRTEPGGTRTLRLRGRRVAGVALIVALTPVTLAACGILGGQTNHGAAPVEISTDNAGQPTGGSAAAGVDPGSNGGAVTATQNSTQIVTSGGATVTRIGIQIRTQVNTQIRTAVKTQQLTKNVTAPPVTNIQTVTDTVTSTVTGPGKTVTAPAPAPVTVFVTKPCPAAPCA